MRCSQMQTFDFVRNKNPSLMSCSIYVNERIAIYTGRYHQSVRQQIVPLPIYHSIFIIGYLLHNKKTGLKAGFLFYQSCMFKRQCARTWRGFQ